MTVAELWHSLDAWRGRWQTRRRDEQRRIRDQQVVLWGGPVEAGRVLAFSDAIFAIAITLLTINLEVRPGLHGAAFISALHQLLPALGAYALSFLILGQLWLAHHRIFGVIARVDYTVLRMNLLFLGLIAIMPFPVRLLSDYSNRPLAVAIYAVTFIAAMALQLVVWMDVTRPGRRDLLSEPVPDQVRAGYGRALGGHAARIRGDHARRHVRSPVRGRGLGPDHPAAAGGGTVRAPAVAATASGVCAGCRRWSAGSGGRPGCS
jgi:uncharacterized membrane protein